jgi:ATP-binding cassette subfamily C protein
VTPVAASELARETPWRMVLRLAGGRRVALILALMLATSLTEGVGLLLLVPILQALDPNAASAGSFGSLLPAGLRSLGMLLVVFVALVTIRAIAGGRHQYESARLTARVLDGLRARALAALLHADWGYLAAIRQSQNRALLITSIDRVWTAISQGLTLLTIAIPLAILAAAAIVLSWQVALAMLVVGALTLLLYRGLRRSARHLGMRLSNAYRSIHARLEESLGGLRLYKSYGREDRALEDAREAFGGLRRAELAFVVQNTIARGALQIGGAALLAGVIWLAIELAGTKPVVLLPLVALCARALPQLQALQDAGQHFSHARPALDEVAALIAEAESKAEPAEPGRAPPRLERAIRLEGVEFAFAGGRAALHAIDLEIPARSTLALVGHSGAGKSTLADILGGLLAPDAGRVLLDDEPLDAAARRAWRGQVAYMQQEAVLFAGSVRDNLLWARPEASEAELRQALERAAARFAFDLPGGIDCDLGEGGRQLSGGERQRIALARALLREPRLLILDEATSAIDAAAEAEVAAAVERLKGTLTVVIIGHRGLLTELADRQVVLENGRIVAAA